VGDSAYIWTQTGNNIAACIREIPGQARNDDYVVEWEPGITAYKQILDSESVTPNPSSLLLLPFYLLLLPANPLAKDESLLPSSFLLLTFYLLLRFPYLMLFLVKS
jgi:hypothetical protein